MIYRVTIKAPAINEEVTVSAGTEEQAAQQAVASALSRQASAMDVTIVEVPDTPPRAA